MTRRYVYRRTAVAAIFPPHPARYIGILEYFWDIYRLHSHNHKDYLTGPKISCCCPVSLRPLRYLIQYGREVFTKGTLQIPYLTNCSYRYRLLAPFYSIRIRLINFQGTPLHSRGSDSDLWCRRPSQSL